MRVSKRTLYILLAAGVIMLLLLVFLVFTDPGKGVLRSVGLLPAEETVFEYQLQEQDFSNDDAETTLEETTSELDAALKDIENNIDDAFESFDPELEFGVQL